MKKTILFLCLSLSALTTITFAKSIQQPAIYNHKVVNDIMIKNHAIVKNEQELRAALKNANISFIDVVGKIKLHHQTLEIGARDITISGEKSAVIVAPPSVKNGISLPIFKIGNSKNPSPTPSNIVIKNLNLVSSDQQYNTVLIKNDNNSAVTLSLKNNHINGLVNLSISAAGTSALNAINNVFTFSDANRMNKNMLISALSAIVSGNGSIMNISANGNKFTATSGPQHNAISAMTFLGQQGSLNINSINNNTVSPAKPYGNDIGLYLGGGELGTVRVIDSISNNKFHHSSVMLAADGKTTMLINSMTGNSGQNISFYQLQMPYHHRDIIYGSDMTLITLNSNLFQQFAITQGNPADTLLIGINNGQAATGTKGLIEYNGASSSKVYINSVGVTNVASNLGEPVAMEASPLLKQNLRLLENYNAYLLF